MQRFLSHFFMLILAVGLQIAIMIYGWGLHPQSWWWILGGGLFGFGVIRRIAERIDKEAKIEELNKTIAALKTVRGIKP